MSLICTTPAERKGHQRISMNPLDFVGSPVLRSGNQIAQRLRTTRIRHQHCQNKECEAPPLSKNDDTMRMYLQQQSPVTAITNIPKYYHHKFVIISTQSSRLVISYRRIMSRIFLYQSNTQTVPGITKIGRNTALLLRIYLTIIIIRRATGQLLGGFVKENQPSTRKLFNFPPEKLLHKVTEKITDVVPLSLKTKQDEDRE